MIRLASSRSSFTCTKVGREGVKKGCTKRRVMLEGQGRGGGRDRVQGEGVYFVSYYD